MVRSPLIIIFLVVVPSAVLGDGVEFQLRRRQTGDAPTGRGKHLKPWLKNRKTSFRAKDTGDVVYSTDIMIGQRTFTVQLDTGSSDLWTNYAPIPADDPSLNITPSGLSAITLEYGPVTGAPAFAPVTLGKYFVPKQGILDFTSAGAGFDGLFNLNVSGILGLGFNGRGASRVRESLFTSDDAGRTFLANIFAQYPEDGNFTTFWLSRDDNDERMSNGLFTINKIPRRYAAAVAAASKLPAFRNARAGDLPRWIVSVDAVQFGGQMMSTSSVSPDAPGGHALAVLDTGTSVAFFPLDVWTAMYSSIPGAVLMNDPAGVTASVWLVPCTARMSVALVFAGQSVFIDPRDLVTPMPFTFKGEQVTVCISALESQEQPNGLSFDFLLGDSFLRNAFQLFNFNEAIDFDVNSTATPYVQLVGLTQEIADDAEYVAQRQAALAGFPPEADLTDPDLILALFGPDEPTTSASMLPSDTALASPTTGPANVFAADVQPGDDLGAEISAHSAQVRDLSARDPLVIGLLAGNVALGLIIVGIVLYLLARSRRPPPRTNEYPVPIIGEYAPVKKGDDMNDAPLSAYRDSA